MGVMDHLLRRLGLKEGNTTKVLELFTPVFLVGSGCCIIATRASLAYLWFVYHA